MCVCVCEWVCNVYITGVRTPAVDRPDETDRDIEWGRRTVIYNDNDELNNMINGLTYNNNTP